MSAERYAGGSLTRKSLIYPARPFEIFVDQYGNGVRAQTLIERFLEERRIAALEEWMNRVEPDCLLDRILEEDSRD